jgi:transposase
MLTKNPQVAAELEKAREELKRLRAEKARLFPPNLHPFAQPDDYPRNATPEMIRQHDQLDQQIEELEQRIEELQWRLYSK